MIEKTEVTEETTKCTEICYFRVSKQDEKEQDLDTQIDFVIKHFKLTNPIIYKERGSAYNLSKIKNRVEFFKLLDVLFDASTTTIKDIFSGDLPQKNIKFYVFGYDRIIRNLELNMLFSLLQSVYGNVTYSYKENYITNKGTSSIERLTSFLLISISAQGSEGYSEAISKNTKKSFKKIGYSSYSIKNGLKVGKQFKNSNGKNVLLSAKKVQAMADYIYELMLDFESKKFKGYYDTIINKVEEQFKVRVSKAYLTKIKGLHNGN